MNCRYLLTVLSFKVVAELSNDSFFVFLLLSDSFSASLLV